MTDPRPRAFGRRAGLLLGTPSVVAWGVASACGQPLSDPIPDPILKQGLRVQIEDVVQFPASLSTTGKPDYSTGSHARINFFRESPDGRYFVNDLRGQLYRLDENLQPQLYVDVDADNGGAGSIFPATWYSNGLAAGFISFTFHPEFETNGQFYTLHMERAADTTAVPDFATTDLGDPNLPVTWQTVITEWDAADPLADTWNESTGSRRELLRVGTTATAYFHPFGDLQFNPTAQPGDDDYGLLYVSGGDWGYINGAGAPQDPDTEGQPGQTQRLDSLAGTMIRFDPRSPSVTGGQAGFGDYTIPADNPFVDGDPDTFDEVYAFGFRNGHRMAWDDDGTLFVSVVGHANLEEVERIVPGGNYGWVNREGTFVNGNDLANGGNGDADVVFANNVPDALDVDFRGEEYLYPVLQYDHDEGFANAGGFVYQGTQVPELYGKFVFGDIVNGRIFAADVSEMKNLDLTDPNTTGAIEEIQLFTDDGFGNLSDVDLQGDFLPGRVDLRFGQDNDGEVWVLTKEDGFLRRLVSAFDAIWNVDGGGLWNTAGNWLAGTVPVANDHVYFGDVLTAGNAPATVHVDAPVNVSALTFNNANGYLLTGNDTLNLTAAQTSRITTQDGDHTIDVTITGSTGLTKAGHGSLTLTRDAFHLGDTRVEQGTLALSGGGSMPNTPTIHISTGATFDVTAVSGGAYTLDNQTLTIDGRVQGNLVATNASEVYAHADDAVTGDVTVQTGSLLAGGGRIAGSVFAQDGTVRVGNAGMPVQFSQFVIDDFESYETGLVRDTADPPWTAHGNTQFAAIEDDGTAGNNVLAFGWNSNYRGTSRGLPNEARIDNTETATLFFRVNAKTADPDHNFGLSDGADTGGADFNDYEAQFRLVEGSFGQIAVTARDGGGFTSTLASISPDAWHNVWMVVDQAADTYDLYLNTGETDATAGDLLADNLAFRNGTTDALDTLLGLAGPSDVDNAVRYDDVHYLAGFDLTNPVSGLNPTILSGGETLTIDGDLVMSPAATLLLDLATEAAHDKLAIGGTLVADGTLKVVFDERADAPELGDAFELLDFASAGGAFAVFDLPALGAGLYWDTSGLLDDGVLEVAEALPVVGDYDNSGQVEQADLDIVLQNWGDADVSDVTNWVNFAGLPGGGIDDQVEQTELDLVLSNWGSSASPDFSMNQRVVPEPTNTAILVACVAVTRRRLRGLAA